MATLTEAGATAAVVHDQSGAVVGIPGGRAQAVMRRNQVAEVLPANPRCFVTSESSH